MRTVSRGYTGNGGAVIGLGCTTDYLPVLHLCFFFFFLLLDFWVVYVACEMCGDHRCRHPRFVYMFRVVVCRIV